MIVAGTHPPISIDLGSNEPGMILQRWAGEWVNYKVDGKVVVSPVDSGEMIDHQYEFELGLELEEILAHQLRAGWGAAKR
jgi:hypothetical protein